MVAVAVVAPHHPALCRQSFNRKSTQQSLMFLCVLCVSVPVVLQLLGWGHQRTSRWAHVWVWPCQRDEPTAALQGRKPRSVVGSRAAHLNVPARTLFHLRHACRSWFGWCAVLPMAMSKWLPIYSTRLWLAQRLSMLTAMMLIGPVVMCCNST